jgi:L-ribulokinase
MKPYVIGLDYGSDSVRALIVDSRDGKEVATSVYAYERWQRGEYCDAGKNRFRQHPRDYITGLERTVREALAKAPPGTAEKVAALSVDTTGSTPAPVDRDGTVLALKEEFTDNPNAMFILWKDHTAVKEAEEINNLAPSWDGPDVTRYEGGTYSSEWFWAKILHVLREDETVREAAHSWVEHCDWLPALLTGTADPRGIKRSRCAAGHKAMWHPDWGGLPPEPFLTRLDPLLAGLRDRLYTETVTADTMVGRLTSEWADRLGLTTEVAVGAGAFDAHMGAVGGQIEPYHLSKVMGTSTCDMVVAPNGEFDGHLIEGICGQVDGSIIPGMTGMEAGQSAFGDIYAWFADLLRWPLDHLPGENRIGNDLLPALEEAAREVPLTESGPLALDWMNGRRTPNANQNLKGALFGLNLGSTAPVVYRALVEATAYGAKAITDCFIRQNVPIRGVIALGGVAKKSPLVMQTVCDVLEMPIRVVRSEQACALGAAMFAAAAGGIYGDVTEAMTKMGSGFEREWTPDPARGAVYRRLYERYLTYGAWVEKQTAEESS